MPYAVTVKDRCMYSHTFTFGDGVPFTTGCTSVVSVTIEGPSLGPFDVLIDICVAQSLLRAACAEYDHKNLDTLDEFKRPDGTLLNTTVEVVARAIHRRMADGLAAHRRENATSDGKGLGKITSLHVKLEARAIAPPPATAALSPTHACRRATSRARAIGRPTPTGSSENACDVRQAVSTPTCCNLLSYSRTSYSTRWPNVRTCSKRTTATGVNVAGSRLCSTHI